MTTIDYDRPPGFLRAIRPTVASGKPEDIGRARSWLYTLHYYTSALIMVMEPMNHEGTQWHVTSLRGMLNLIEESITRFNEEYANVQQPNEGNPANDERPKLKLAK